MTAKERDDLILKHLEKISNSIFGNGQLGLKSKVEKIETRIDNIEDFIYKNIENTITACMLKLVGKISKTVTIILSIPAGIWTILKIFNQIYK